MIDSKIKSQIIALISEIERQENVRIFFACESGSRAWGFPSADSDYDVRFLYLHKPEWYLSIDAGADVIERPISGQIDLSGWDMKKALRLFRKSNPPLLEWLQSPIIYCEKYQVAQRLRQLLPDFYSPVSCLYHYLHMAEGNYREYLKGDSVWLKKYFYMLRPVLACKWIEADYGAVPTEFSKLVDKIVDSPALRDAISELLTLKQAGDELAWGPRIPRISDFLELEIERLRSRHFGKHKPKPDTEKLNELFRKSLTEVWAN